MRVRVSLLMACAGLWALMGGGSTQAKAGEEGELAERLITLLKVGRAVVSEHQPLINDASKGEKGFTDTFAERQIIDQFKAKTQVDLSHPSGVPQRDVLLAMLESEREVVFDAQPVINKQGIGFKGFVPSVFARKVGQKFFAKTGIKIRLTGTDYRYLGNKPDDFEAEILRMFADPRHPKGQPYAKVTTLNGKPVMRIMDPEYAETTCLLCHGGPKGDRDLTGTKKEGWKEGELAGAISVVLPLR